MSLLVLTIAGTVIGGLVVAELIAEAPRIAERLLRMAIRCAPHDLKDRLREEWARTIEDTPGSLGKVICAALLCKAALHVSAERSMPGVIIIGRLLLTRPRALWLFWVGWRNWPRVAALARQGGIAIPQSPFDLSLRDLLKRYRDGSPHTPEVDLAPIRQWATNNAVLAVMFMGIAARKPASKLCGSKHFRDSMKSLDGIYYKCILLLEVKRKLEKVRDN